ncbi:AbiH family protein [Streptococcus mitis]|jgi:hypothetical protein|uniref:Uncharacterized protein n=1 Tax=Streptococcus mitis TaxID=28037 RepID=A0A6M9F7N5_STRMT|nr:AbiH family protein [Streptococcus mitis]QKL33625.1 hypothetical protein M594_07990 [Streptococcus mitis]
MSEEASKNDKGTLNRPETKVVIVGNGFDISADLKSSYNNFIEYIRIEEKLETNEEIYNFNKLFLQKFDGKSLNWNDLESIFENHIKEINEITYNSDAEIRSRYSVTEINTYLKELEELFSSYLSEVYEEWRNLYRIRKNNNKRVIVNEVYKNIFKDADIINFNYTSTLFDLDLIQTGSGQISRYFQVHGSLVEQNIIFGGGFTGNEEFSVFNIPGSMDNDKLIRIKKDTNLFEKRIQLLEKIKNYQENSVDTYIIGHSIYGSDLPFLSKIFEKSKRIYLFYYGNDYLIKLQMVSKVLSSDVLEKIVLVPFYDILVNIDDKRLEFGGNNPDSIQLDDIDIELLKRIFNISLPIAEPFDNFILTNKLFIFKQFRYLKISNVLECNSLKKILKFLEISETDIEGLHVIIDGVEAMVKDALPLDELFDMDEFTKCIKNSKSIEITNSWLSVEKLLGIFLNAEKCEKLKISNCTFYYGNEENINIDVSRLQNIEYLEISKNNINEGRMVNIIASNEIISNSLKKIVVRENLFLKTDHSLMNFSQHSRYFEMDYPNNGEFGYEIHFSNVLTFILDAQEVDINPVISGITLTPNVRTLKLLEISLSDKKIDLKEETSFYKLSSLFKFDNKNKNTRFLSNLEEIELSVLDNGRELLFDVIPNTQQITYNGEQIELIKLLVKEQSVQKAQQEIFKEQSEEELLIDKESFIEVDLETITDQKKTVDITDYDVSSPKSVEGEVMDDTEDKVYKVLLAHLTENILLHSDDGEKRKKKVAKDIENEISDFAKEWAIDKQALTFYILNFDIRRKEGKQRGETALRKTANYEEYSHKSNKNKLQYRQSLNIAIREFATTLHEKYSL